MVTDTIISVICIIQMSGKTLDGSTAQIFPITKLIIAIGTSSNGKISKAPSDIF
jgi:hypothetical protein